MQDFGAKRTEFQQRNNPPKQKYSLFVLGLYTFLPQLGQFTFEHHLPAIVSNKQTLKRQFLELCTATRHLAHHMRHWLLLGPPPLSHACVRVRVCSQRALTSSRTAGQVRLCLCMWRGECVTSLSPSHSLCLSSGPHSVLIPRPSGS